MYRDTFLLLGFLRFLGFRANRQFYVIRNYRLSRPSVKIIFYRVDLAHRAHSLTPYQYQDSLLGAPQQGCLREIMTVTGET